MIDTTKTIIVLITLLLATLSAAHAGLWVDLTEEGENIRIREENEVNRCEKLGTTSVTTKATILKVRRKQHIIQNELNTMARNGGADLGGDTVAPITEIKDGRQTFGVYQCLPATQEKVIEMDMEEDIIITPLPEEPPS